MSFQVLGQREALPTNVALVRLLLGMREHVVLKILHARGTEIAALPRTAHRTAGVDKPVRAQLTPMGRRVAADVAEVFLAGRVPRGVVAQRVSPLERSAAPSTDERAGGRVLRQVRDELRPRTELCRTAAADERRSAGRDVRVIGVDVQGQLGGRRQPPLAVVADVVRALVFAVVLRYLADVVRRKSAQRALELPTGIPRLGLARSAIRGFIFRRAQSTTVDRYCTVGIHRTFCIVSSNGNV